MSSGTRVRWRRLTGAIECGGYFSNSSKTQKAIKSKSVASSNLTVVNVVQIRESVRWRNRCYQRMSRKGLLSVQSNRLIIQVLAHRSIEFVGIISDVLG
jgi:hypothetical protein